MQMKAKRKVLLVSNTCLEKLTIRWNAEQNSSECLYVVILPIPHVANSKRIKNGNTLRFSKSKCHRNHVIVMKRTYCHTGNSLSSYCKNPFQLYFPQSHKQMQEDIILLCSILR